jgi:hypothetical protein
MYRRSTAAPLHALAPLLLTPLPRRVSRHFCAARDAAAAHRRDRFVIDCTF